jgi:putative heme iron utilization protein
MRRTLEQTQARLWRTCYNTICFRRESTINRATSALDPIRPTDDTARATARRLLRIGTAASLGTLDADGMPAVTLTAMATAFDGTPVLLVSGLSAHTRNLTHDARVSLLVARSGRGDPLAHARITVFARAEALARDEAEHLGIARRYLAHNPKAALYAGLPDFRFVRLNIVRASLNGGFGKAYELVPADLMSDAAAAADLAGTEEGAIAHMNADHTEALELYAERLCRKDKGRWRATGVDPEGLNMQAGDQRARLVFPQPITDGAGLRRMLKDLAAEARAAREDAGTGA